MEGPLVSDTTEVLSGAAPASEDPPIGHPAASAGAPRSTGRNGGDLSKLLVSDLQRLAQELGIPGTGRMRKGDLVAAITERTGGGRSTPRQSATRAASAGADVARPLNQDAMEADTTVRSGIGESAPAARGGIGQRAGRAAGPVSARPSAPSSRPPRTVAPSRRARRQVSSPTPSAAESIADSQHGNGQDSRGQDGRRDRRRNGRRDEQGGNGRDQRRDSRDNRDSPRAP